jgi:hypothetical protein
VESTQARQWAEALSELYWDEKMGRQWGDQCLGLESEQASVDWYEQGQGCLE